MARVAKKKQDFQKGVPAIGSHRYLHLDKISTIDIGDRRPSIFLIKQKNINLRYMCKERWMTQCKTLLTSSAEGS